MKNELIIIGFTLCSLLTSSCALIFKYGNGKVVKQEKKLTDFSAVEVSSGFNIYLNQSEKERIIIEIDENLQKYVEARVDSGVLKVEASLLVRKATKRNVYVNTKNIDNINLSGGGNLICDSLFETDKLTVNIKGGGDMEMEVNSPKFDLIMSGGGDAKIIGEIVNASTKMSGGGDLSIEVGCKELKIDVSGGGHLKAKVNTQNLNCSISGGGNGNILGSTEIAKFQVRGGGDLFASDLIIENANVNVSGGSDATLKVTSNIEGNVRGGGDLLLKDNPVSININKSGGSKVKVQ